MPDHSTFSKNWHGWFPDSDLLRHLFETVVRGMIKERLVGGEGFATDASLIATDTNKQRSVEGSAETDWPELAKTQRAIQEYLDTLDDAAWGSASAVTPKFIATSDPAGAMDWCLQGPCLLCLPHQLRHRSSGIAHRGRAVRPLSGAAGGGLGLRQRRNTQLTHAREMHRAARGQFVV